MKTPLLYFFLLNGKEEVKNQHASFFFFFVDSEEDTQSSSVISNDSVTLCNNSVKQRQHSKSAFEVSEQNTGQEKTWEILCLGLTQTEGTSIGQAH